MNFAVYLNEKEVKEKDFISKVKKYQNLDQALMKLPDEYTEFYLKNINSKSLNKKLKQEKLIEEYEGDADVQKSKTTGTSPEPGKFKRLHYKGHYIVLQYTKEFGWTAQPTFRSITNALEYVKGLADDYLD
jgi:hypothetical protein